jgi:hypothetical protein
MLILAIIIALLVDAVAITALVALLRRSDTTWLRVGAIVGTTLVVMATALCASLATVTVQSRIVMYAMARQEPTATILRIDRDMRDRLRIAVVKGLSQEGPKVDNVKQAVSAVLHPYMAYRLRTAPDRFTIRSARTTLAMLEKAKAQGTDVCAAVLSGDVATMQRLADPASADWLPEMLRSTPLDDVRTATPAESAAVLSVLTASRGWSAEDVAAATARRGPLACDLPIAVIGQAVDMPEEKGAALLRSLGFGGQAVTAGR